MKPSGILCGPLPLFAALKSFLGLRVALGCSLKLSGGLAGPAGLAGLAGLAGQAGPRPGNEILEVLLGWPKMVPEPLIFIDFE